MVGVTDFKRSSSGWTWPSPDPQQYCTPSLRTIFVPSQREFMVVKMTFICKSMRITICLFFSNLCIFFQTTWCCSYIQSTDDDYKSTFALFCSRVPPYLLCMQVMLPTRKRRHVSHQTESFDLAIHQWR